MTYFHFHRIFSTFTHTRHIFIYVRFRASLSMTAWISEKKKKRTFITYEMCNILYIQIDAVLRRNERKWVWHSEQCATRTTAVRADAIAVVQNVIWKLFAQARFTEYSSLCVLHPGRINELTLPNLMCLRMNSTRYEKSRFDGKMLNGRNDQIAIWHESRSQFSHDRKHRQKDFRFGKNDNFKA